jgi:hypothetical protein
VQALSGLWDVPLWSTPGGLVLTCDVAGQGEGGVEGGAPPGRPHARRLRVHRPAQAAGTAGTSRSCEPSRLCQGVQLLGRYTSQAGTLVAR